MKIMVIGAGGIGGYFAGLLSRACPEDITLVARGAQLAAIREKGLTIINAEERFTVTPALVTDKPEQAGVQDIILFCTKNYGLAQAVQQAAPCIGPNTLLLPLLNGISSRDVIEANTSSGIALHGCIYIFSKILEPGVIVRGSKICRVCMGLPKTFGPTPQNLIALRDILLGLGIQAEIPEDITASIWQKYVMMISNAQGCAYFNVPIGEVRNAPEKFAFLRELLGEALAVAHAHGVQLPDNTQESTMNTILALEYDSTPSIMRDLNTPGQPTELDLFAGELCRLADLHGVAVPANRKVLERYKDRV